MDSGVSVFFLLFLRIMQLTYIDGRVQDERYQRSRVTAPRCLHLVRTSPVSTTADTIFQPYRTKTSTLSRLCSMKNPASSYSQKAQICANERKRPDERIKKNQLRSPPIARNKKPNGPVTFDTHASRRTNRFQQKKKTTTHTHAASSFRDPHTLGEKKRSTHGRV